MTMRERARIAGERPWAYVAAVLLIVSGAAPRAAADTLFLKSGAALKIDALRCDAAVCVANLKGGEIEVRPRDVLRVEADEYVDPTPETGKFNATSSVSSPKSVDDLVAEAARKYALPRSLVRAVARAESAFNAKALSPKGAQGVMQLMPGTSREMGVTDAFDPEQNIEAGTKRLRQLLEKYEGHVAEALAAYNAGEGAVAKHKGVPPYAETRGYVRKVVKDFERNEKTGAPSAPNRK